MTLLEELRPGAIITGIQVGQIAANTRMAITDRLVLKPDRIRIWVCEPDGHIGTTDLDRSHEATINLVTPAPSKQRSELRPYIDCGIILAPLPIEAAYVDAKGLSHVLKATILSDGCVSVNGERCPGLTKAAKAAIKAVTKVDKDLLPEVDGWNFWRFRNDDGELIYTRVFDDRYKAHFKNDRSGYHE